VLKNSLAQLLAAIFGSWSPAQQLFIALLDNTTNQSFAVYGRPDFFNNIGHYRPLPSIEESGWYGLRAADRLCEDLAKRSANAETELSRKTTARLGVAGVFDSVCRQSSNFYVTTPLLPQSRCTVAGVSSCERVTEFRWGNLVMPDLDLIKQAEQGVHALRQDQSSDLEQAVGPPQPTRVIVLLISCR
jgi:hypothetical protein